MWQNRRSLTCSCPWCDLPVVAVIDGTHDRTALTCLAGAVLRLLRTAGDTFRVWLGNTAVTGTAGPY